LVGCRLWLVSAHSRAVEHRPRCLQRRVLGQQGEDRIDLAPLEGIGEALHDLSQTPVAEPFQGRTPAWLQQLLLQRPAGTEDRPVHRCDCDFERVRHLLRGEAEHVAEDEHRPLAGGEVLQRSDEGELQHLAPLVASRGRRVAIRAGERFVSVRLDPQSA
jgi:hypothetical protein